MSTPLLAAIRKTELLVAPLPHSLNWMMLFDAELTKVFDKWGRDPVGTNVKIVQFLWHTAFSCSVKPLDSLAGSVSGASSACSCMVWSDFSDLITRASGVVAALAEKVRC